MKALADYVVVEPISDVQEHKGFITDEVSDYNLRYNKGKVISVGSLVGEVLKPGEVVLYDKLVNSVVRVNGIKVSAVRLRDCVMVP